MSEIPEVFLPAPKEIRGVDPSCDLSSVSGSNRTADFPRLNRVLNELGLNGRLQEIEIANPPTKFPALEDSYRYEVHLGGEGFRLRADTEWGAITACHTLRQRDLDKSALSNVVIRDHPTYPWRGLMIDVARHYINLKELHLTLDLMAHFHLNVLHLHLSDDQGFRFESKRFTKLQTAPFYTQEQLSDLVEYAADRAIRVVPELDVPGHVTSWLTSYPSWGGKSQVEPSTGFGVHHACLDPSNPELMPNLLDLFAELGEVFQDQYVHIGGDEVPGQWWNESTAIRDLMDRNGWTEIREVQAWFTQNLVNGIERSGKKVIGWDEVLDPTLSSSVTVQAWRGMQARDLAASHGHPCILSSPYYLDLHYPADAHYLYYPDMSADEWHQSNESMINDKRLSHVKDGIRWSTSFGLFPELTERSQGPILGGEACMWSELVDSSVLIGRVWSRLSIIAERFWNGASALPVEDTYARATKQTSLIAAKLEIHNPQYLNLAKVDVALRPLIPMFEQLEPIKWYGRVLGLDRLRARVDGQAEAHIPRPYDLSSEFNRWIDHLPPESLPARHLAHSLKNEPDLSQLQRKWDQLPHEVQKLESQVSLEEYELLLSIAEAFRELSQIWRGTKPPNLELQEPIGECLIPIAHQINQIAFSEILRHWDVEGDVESIDVGHINDTYRIGQDYLLQRINTRVFSSPEAVSENLQKALPHIRDLVPEQITTTASKPYVQTPSGYWRLNRYHNSRNFSVLPLELCEPAGRAFGTFLSRFKNQEISLQPVIQGFHNLRFYLDELERVQTPDSVQNEIEFVRLRSRYLDQSLGKTQVIHGDCKVNNLLFDLSKPEVLKIIDLDTLMVGSPALDYGDFIRSVVAGDDIETAKDKIRLATKGFLSAFPIEPDDSGTFVRATAYVSFMLGVRYLTDHCSGDTYFKVKSHGENLEKCRERFELTRKFEEFEDELGSILRHSRG